MTTPLQFYAKKALQLGISLSELCSNTFLDFADDTISPRQGHKYTIHVGPQKKGGIGFYQYSEPKPNGISLLAAVRLTKPNLEALANSSGAIQELEGVVHREYYFAVCHNSDEAFLEVTIMGQLIADSRISETKTSGSSNIQIPLELFKAGRDYRDGLTWMLEQYARR